MDYSFSSIGTLKTCFGEKFGVPRQSLMVSDAWGVLKLAPDPSYYQAIQHLSSFSHVWLIYLFHKNGNQAWRPVIEPPRIGEVQSLGVFASRSPHRPNPIGLSVVKLERIDLEAEGGIEIYVTGVDILDGTPVLDIKPYLPYADRVEGATAGWATAEIERFSVEFSEESKKAIEEKDRKLIEQVLAWDPRPTSQRKASPIKDPSSNGLKFAFRILELDIRWQVRDGAVYVYEVVRFL